MDRVFISESYREFVDDLKEKDILGFGLAENRDSFLLALALGIHAPHEMIGKKFNFIRFDTFKPGDKAIISAALLGTATSDQEIDAFADFEECVEYGQQCAETGYRELQKLVSGANWERELLEDRLMRKLDQLYTQNVLDDL